MRGLVFTFPGTQQRLENEIKNEAIARLQLDLHGNARPITAIDANRFYGIRDWDDLAFVLKHHAAEFGCAVVVVDGSAIDHDRSNAKANIRSYQRAAKEIPLLAYADGVGPTTHAKLIQEGVVYVVDRSHHPSTLALCSRNAINLQLTSHQEIKIGAVTIDLTSGFGHCDGNSVHFTHTEQDILLLFHKRRGSVCSKAHIYDAAGISSDDPKIIDVHLCKIRTKLNGLRQGAGDELVTSHGKGYYLKDAQQAGQVLTLPLRRPERTADRPDDTHLETQPEGLTQQ